jgi:putative transcriptional regulator
LIIKQKQKSKRNNKTKAPSQEWSNIKGVKRDRLTLERKKRKLTQGELADLMGVSTATISHLENGRMQPSLELSLELPNFFNLSFETLFPDL